MLAFSSDWGVLAGFDGNGRVIRLAQDIWRRGRQPGVQFCAAWI
jgi:hypothetical protein